MSHTLQAPTVIQLPNLAAHHSRKIVYAVFVLLASGTAIAIITAIAHWSGSPLVVPSLGPTAFLVFNRSQSSVAQPRNILFGHLIGAAAGYLSLLAFGLTHAPSVVEGGVTTSRIGAAALSIGLTSAAMILFGAEHPPAGATTLIVSLGFMRSPASVGLLMAGVISLAALGVLIDRLVGLRLPYWSGHQSLPVVHRLRHHLRQKPASPPTAIEHSRTRLPGHSALRRLRPSVELPEWMVGPGEGRQGRTGSEVFTVKAEDAHAGGPYSLLEVVFEPEAASAMLHAHYDFAETYFILEGEVWVDVGGSRRRATPGMTVTVPVGLPHSLVAVDHQAARCLCITNRSRESHLEYLP